MTEPPQRRGRWPHVTVHTIYFSLGCTIGWLQMMARDREDEDLARRAADLRQRLEAASMWTQRESFEQALPLTDEASRLVQSVLGEQPITEHLQQLAGQLREILPPDVQF